MTETNTTRKYDYESPVDIEATAERLDVDPRALAGAVDHFESRHCPENYPDGRPLIETIHRYWGAVALVTLTEGISHSEAGREDYALVSFNGYVFPFAPGDVKLLEGHVDALPDDEVDQ